MGKNNNKNNYTRKTYYLRDDQIEKIRKKAFYKRKDLSEIVREALDIYLYKGKNKVSRK